jgi:hypothetical protein
VRARSIALSPAQAGALIAEGQRTDEMAFSAAHLSVGQLRLEAATLHKHGRAVSAEATASSADVAAALPSGVQLLRVVRATAGKVQVVVSGGLFGMDVPISAIAEASGGEVIAHPLGFPLEGVRVPIFSAPHLYVESVSATPITGASSGYRLAMTGRVH